MKKYFYIIIPILILTKCSVDNKPTIENWYGVIKYADNSTDKVVLHVKTTDSYKSISVDFPFKNNGSIWGHDAFFDIDADTTIRNANDYSFIISGLELDFAGKINSEQTEISGQIVLSGKPFNIVFNKDSTKLVLNKSIAFEQVPGLSIQAGAPDKEMKRPIEKINSLFTEELTWLEIRDAMKEGKTTIIIPTGGIEQNGTFLATGKHNYILKLITDSIAHKLGNALVAPIIPFVPEGNHSPPTSHMKYPGTISLSETTYEQLLREIAISYKTHGFKVIIFIGDSGGNQWGMYVVAKELNAKWKKDSCQVLFIHEYYDNYRVAQWLKGQGINEIDLGVHDNLQYTSQLMVSNPILVRANERIAKGSFSVNGVNLQPIDKTIELGKKLINYQADITVDAIKKSFSKSQHY